MVQRPKTAREAEWLLRKAARKTGKTWTVMRIKGNRGRTRGKGAHVMWGVYDANGKELARGSLTTHRGDMSWTVTRGFEADFKDLLGEGWMDR